VVQIATSGEDGAGPEMAAAKRDQDIVENRHIRE